MATEWQRRKYIGDALYMFIAKEVLLNDLENYRDNKLRQRISSHITANKFMTGIAIKMGMIESCGGFGKGGNIVEARIYEEFLEGGIEKAKQWFIDNVFPHCSTLEIMKIEDLAIQNLKK